MAQDCYGSTDSHPKALRDGCPQGDPICQVMQTISNYDDPSEGLDVTQEGVDR